MKTLLALAFASSITAQTLTISPSGQVRLEPPQPAVLFAADTPRSKEWQVVTEFDHLVQVDTNRTRFYRAYIKSPPLKLLRLTETNQTLRGVCDKEFTNVLLVVHGVTNKGWSYFGEGRLPRLNQGEQMPVTTRSDFSFHRLAGITNTTPARLIIWDDDGYVLETNVFIGPGPFMILLPRHLRPKAGLSPAAAPDPQTTSGWGLLSHSGSQTLEVPNSESQECKKDAYSYHGSWDGSTSLLSVKRELCVNGVMTECGANYSGVASGPMILSSSYGCPYVDTRNYMAGAMIGTYDSNSDDTQIDSRLTHTANSDAELWIGGRLRGSGESNYWARISVAVQTPIERFASDLVWGESSLLPVNSIGGVPTKNRSIYVQVPPDGITIRVTPGFGKMNSGLHHYEVSWLIAPMESE